MDDYDWYVLLEEGALATALVGDREHFDDFDTLAKLPFGDLSLLSKEMKMRWDAIEDFEALEPKVEKAFEDDLESLRSWSRETCLLLVRAQSNDIDAIDDLACMNLDKLAAECRDRYFNMLLGPKRVAEMTE